MTYEEFAAAVQALAEMMRGHGFAPDAIVAVSRGGWIPARLLSTYLGANRLYSLGVAYDDPERSQLTAYQVPDLAAGAHRILVVEDFLESGRSLRHAVSLLRGATRDVRTAAVGHTRCSVVVPDYTLGLLETIPTLPWD